MIGRVIRRRMSSRHVAVVGSVCVDSFIGVPRLPSSGETLVCRRVVLFFSFSLYVIRRFISTFSLQESRNLLTKTGLELILEVYRFFRGGKGANQAAGVASFESKSFFIGRIGDDADADIIQDALKGKVVDVSCMPRNSSVPSGKAFIFLNPTVATLS